jgi:serine/threonine-protein kinase
LHQLLPVLTYIHTIGVVHRDISPDNLMLRTPDRLPVLIDFGGVKQIAKTVMHQVNPAIAPTGKVTRLGKAGYAPAEQMEQGDVSPHSDLYALAVTILVLLTGKEPEAALGSDRRQWQRDLNLSPPLVTVLDRMLAPFPQKRYQSAAEVLQALPKGTHATTPNVVNPNMATSNAATSNAVNPQAAAHSIYQPTVAIAPINRTVAHVPASQSTPRPPRSSSSRSIGGIVTFILLLLVAGASIGGFWMANQLVKPFGKSNSPKPKPANSTTQGQSQAIPEISEREQKRKQTLDQQRQQLGIDEAFLVQLTDETFYRRRAIGRALSNSPADESLRTEWDGMAKQALDRLEKLSSETRSRLGNYTEADLATRRNAAAQLNLSSRAFNDLTDARFFALFPDQPRDADLVQQPIGQVWQAIAAEQLKALQTGTTIERLKPNTQQLNGKLKPGEGKIYLASLIKNQPLQLRLEAAAATRLSFYPPTNKSALLEDSTEQQWSGKLPESGWYELVIVSDAKKTVEYTIDLATNN